jgi:HAD superfamily hydrolase (TIGR01509 family)
VNSRLLEVALDRIGVTHVRVLGVGAGGAQRPTLAEQIPAAVELHLDGSQPVLIGLEPVRVHVVGFLPVAEIVLLGNEPLDPIRDRVVAHGTILLPVVVRTWEASRSPPRIVTWSNMSQTIYEPEAVLFDQDGVLIDSEGAWDAARRAVVAENGGRWKDEATRAMMGMSSPEWSRYLRDELGVALAPEQISDRVVARLLAGYSRELPLLPGAVDAVKRLAARWPVGLASSANREVIDAVLAATGLSAVFGATVSGEEVARGKPAPDIYLEGARRLGVDPHRCAAVEDSTNGLRSASAAGMLVVALPNREFPPADDALTLAAVVLDSLEELAPSTFASTSAPPRARG